MTRSELIERVAAKMPNLTIKEVERIVSVFFNKLIKALSEGNRVEIRGFGTFSVRKRAPRMATNPRSKGVLEIPAKNVLHFKTGKELHNRLNG